MEPPVWYMTMPSSLLITGPSGSGKSSFCEILINSPHLWDKKIDNIYYCYGIYSDDVKKITSDHPEVIINQGLPRNIDNPTQIFSPSKNNVLWLDDLTTESQNSKDVTNFLVRGCHHTNTSLLSCEHHLFSDCPERRKQTHHWNQIVLFKNLRGLYQIGTLARQCGLGSSKFLQEAFNDATCTPYSHLLLDLRSQTPNELRILSNVLSTPVYAYINS